MASRRLRGWAAALAAVGLLALAAGCDRGGDASTSPFRNLGKRGDGALAGNAARPTR
jgi:hypothetical protein